VIQFWVIVYKLTKSAHFIPIKTGQLVTKLAKIYIEQIVGLYGISSSIVSYRDSRFTSRFWESLQEALGTKVDDEFCLSSSNGRSHRKDQDLDPLQFFLYVGHVVVILMTYIHYSSLFS
jgi:hypothetical protein